MDCAQRLLVMAGRCRRPHDSMAGLHEKQAEQDSEDAARLEPGGGDEDPHAELVAEAVGDSETPGGDEEDDAARYEADDVIDHHRHRDADFLVGHAADEEDDLRGVPGGGSQRGDVEKRAV